MELPLELKPMLLGAEPRPVTAMEVLPELKPMLLGTDIRLVSAMEVPPELKPMLLGTDIERRIAVDIYFKKSVPIPGEGSLGKIGGTGCCLTP